MVQNELLHVSLDKKQREAEAGTIEPRESAPTIFYSDKNTDHEQNSPAVLGEEKAATRFKVAYWLPDKFISLTKWEAFMEMCFNNCIDLVKLDLSGSIEDQLPFDLLFHKIISLYKPKLRGCDSNVDYSFNNLFKFIENHPEVPTIDPVEPQLQLFNREHVCKLIEQVCVEVDQCETSLKLSIPAWYKLEKAPLVDDEFPPEFSDLKFPCICKCVHTWDKRSHEMSIVFSWSQLIHLSAALPLRYPIILQNFVRHQKILFKIYVIGQQTIVQKRPSVDVPDEHSCDTSPIHFNGHAISKSAPLSATESDQLVSSDLEASFDKDLVAKVVKSIRARTNLAIFGLDFLVASTLSADGSTGSSTHFLVDVNPFPGCSSLDNLHQHLLSLLLSQQNSECKSES